MLASDSSMDRSANKQELVYTRSLCNGEVRTAFLGLRNLRDGRAESIMAAYKQAMLHAGLPVEKWVARVFWYCANGAEVCCFAVPSLRRKSVHPGKKYPPLPRA